MVRDLTGQMVDVFGENDDIQPIPIMPEGMLTEPLPDPNAPEYREMRRKFAQDVFEGVITSPFTAVADTVELGAMLPDLPANVAKLMPRYTIVENAFDELLNLGINRENTVDLIRETTGIELTGSAGEFTGELIGLPSAAAIDILTKLPGVVRKYSGISGSTLDDVVDEVRSIFSTASGGDGMSPALAGAVPATSPTTKIADEAPLPDTSISPTMVGANTPSGKQAIGEYEEYALDITNEGFSEEDLYIMSGVYKGPDGKHRFEIDTSNVKLNYESMDEAGILLEGSMYRDDPILLRDVLDFPELYREYDATSNLAKGKPLGDIEITFQDNVDFEGAYFAADDNIVINSKYLDRLVDTSPGARPADEERKFISLLLHEVQHAVQRREDFITGSAPESMYRAAASQLGFTGIRNSDDVLRRMRAISDVDHDDMVMQRLRSVLDDEFTPVGSDLDHMVFNEILADIAMQRYSRVKYGPVDAVPMGMYRFTEKDIADYFNNPQNDKLIKESELDEQQIYYAVMDAIHGISEQNLKRILHPSVRASREYNELRRISDVANLRYKRKYGEIEARIVEFRYSERLRLKGLGYTPEQINSAMADMYPPLQAHIDEAIAAVDPDFMRGLPKVDTPYGPKLVITPEKALGEGTESVAFDAAQSANTVPPLEIGTNPATEGGALLANYTADTAADLVEKAKNATVGVNKELVGKEVDAGTQVAVRLNLNSTIPNAPKGLDKLQTLHDKTPNGTALSYLPFATVENVEFFVNQTGRRNIAAKIKGLDVKEATSKFPAMSVNGQYNPTRNVLEEMDDDVVEIGFNPANTHLFVDMATGQAVKSAEVATVIGNRVYAKGVTYMKKADAPEPKLASDGTPLESEVRYKFKKGGLV